ncbi:glycosyltransferase [Verrucomicrobiota bacterium sgz303538]
MSTAKKCIELSVVIPFFNEGESVTSVLNELRGVLDAGSRTYEVVAVDDGSADDTAACLQRCSTDWPQLEVVIHDENRGQAAALWTGFETARGALIATLDGDGQNDPLDFEPMLQKLEESGADLVAGVRADRHDSTLRRQMSRLANRVRGALLHDQVSDTGCAIKVFRREVLRSLIPLRTLYSFIPAMAVAAGFRVVEMPVRHRARAAGESKYGLGVMLWRPALDMLGVWWFSQRRFAIKTRQLERSTSNTWRSLLLAIVAFTLFLGTRGLNEPDEGRYAEIAREMASGSSWLVPHLNGFEHFQKPPLLYWLTATSLHVFGVNEWAARIPSALAAVGIVLLTRAIARRLWNEQRAEIATLILLSSVEFFLLARLLTPDMMLTFWSTAAIASLVFRRRWTFFICMGLGFLTKGPMALVVPIAAAIGWQIATRREEDRLRLPWLRGLALTLAISLSWFVVLSVSQPRLFDYFWRYELVQRFASTAHGRSKPWWFFGPVLLAGLLPWTFLLPRTARAAWQLWKKRTWAARHGLLAGWVAVPLLVLSLSGSKLPTYILPLFPAFALALASAFQRPRQAWWIATPAAAAWLVMAAAAPFADSILRQQASVRSLAQKLAHTHHASDATVFACGVRAHGLEFYLKRLVNVTAADADIVLPPPPPDAARVFEDVEDCAKAFVGSPAFGIIRKSRFHQLFAGRGWTALAESGDFVLVGNSPAVDPPQQTAKR